MTSRYTCGSMTKLHDFGGVLGRLLDTFFWALKIHGHGSWLVGEVSLNLAEVICREVVLQVPTIR